MQSADSSAEVPSAVWDVIDQLLDDITLRARSDIDPELFYGELLRRTCEALAALGGGVWETGGETLRRVSRFNAAMQATPADSEAELEQLLAAVLERREECWIQPGGRLSAVGAIATPANPLSVALAICPILIEGRTSGALVLEHRPDVAPDARHATLRVLTSVAELAADFQRNRQRRMWQARASAADEMESLLTSLYRDLDVRNVAYAAANDGRRWLGADRVGVLTFDGRRAIAAAISGVDRLDRRADQIRGLERLASATIRLGMAIRFPDATSDLPPEVLQALSNYVDVAHPTEFIVAPLTIDDHKTFADGNRPDDAATGVPRVVGALIVERFAGRVAIGEPGEQRLQLLLRHAGAALANAREVENIPGSRWWRRFQSVGARLRRRRRAILFWTMLVAALIAVPFLIPADYTIEAAGTLEPSVRRDIFMPSDAMVSEVAVGHGVSVQAGATLVKLHHPELERELARVGGDIAAAKSRLATLTAFLAAGRVPSDGASMEELSAEKEQLGPKLLALEEEFRLLDQRRKELNVTAPFAGTVTTWDAERLLVGRPITQGTKLMSLAATEGDWQLELNVPDRNLAALAEARANTPEPLKVEFITAADPRTKHEGRLERLAQAATTDDERRTTVAAVAVIQIAGVVADQRRPGATVTAKIYCGRSSLGVVWCRDIMQFVRSNILF